MVLTSGILVLRCEGLKFALEKLTDGVDAGLTKASGVGLGAVVHHSAEEQYPVKEGTVVIEGT